jgi:hypothetical protein
VPYPGNTIHIPINEEGAILAFMKVKPTADMPRPRAHPVKKNRAKHKAKP